LLRTHSQPATLPAMSMTWACCNKGRTTQPTMEKKVTFPQFEEEAEASDVASVATSEAEVCSTSVGAQILGETGAGARDEEPLHSELKLPALRRLGCRRYSLGVEGASKLEQTFGETRAGARDEEPLHSELGLPALRRLGCKRY